MNKNTGIKKDDKKVYHAGFAQRRGRRWMDESCNRGKNLYNKMIEEKE